MTRFVNLDRRFRDLTPDERKDPELLDSWSAFGSLDSVGWPELLEAPRVVLLAEAGSGKTCEMEQQATRLREERCFAFFIPIEQLDRDAFPDILSADDQRAFDTWKLEGQAPAWFFLDAVDELKLTTGKLDRVLKKFAKALDVSLDRARVIVSCRPSDWRPQVDLEAMRKTLPLPLRQPAVLLEPDKAFLAPLRREQGRAATNPENEHNGTDIRTVVMCRLDNHRIRQFAASLNVQDPAGFFTEIDRQNAWLFAHRPLDLQELVATWNTSRHLGTRTEQHENNIRHKLRDDPERRDRGVLPAERAREGAERLALALALTRTRTIRAPEQSLDMDRSQSVLDAADVLPDWSEEKHLSLLRRGIFDPATYGRIRFHHRSVQEYLAACHLKKLREKGMPVKALRRLLFAEKYGERVVFPSMQEVAAWLALWVDDVRRELMEREPEVLLLLGDPEGLPVGERKRLLRKLAAAYENGGRRGIRVPIEEVRRLAHPDLAPLIRELWAEQGANDELRDLLIQMIWQGPISDCQDIARTAVLDENLNDRSRIDAFKALLACDCGTEARDIVNDIIGNPAAWPATIVRSLVIEVFPEIVSVAELITLMERAEAPLSVVDAWSASQIVARIDPKSNASIELRDQFADLIWRHRKRHAWKVNSTFAHLATALAILCDRQLASQPGAADPRLIRACVVANRCGRESMSSRRDAFSNLAKHFDSGSRMRERLFWTDCSLLREAGLDPISVWWALYVPRWSLLGGVVDSDRVWLEAAVRNTTLPEHRGIALMVVMELWKWSGQDPAWRDALRDAVADNDELTAMWKRQTAPPDPQVEALKKDDDLYRREQDEKEQKRLRDWKRWRDNLLADPETAFSKENRLVTIINLYPWLDTAHRTNSRYGLWDREALVASFNDDIADRAAAALQALWREQVLVLWSARSDDERNSIPLVWILACCGLSSGAQALGWATRLNSEEARVAAACATIELNGFPSWVNDLVAAHPKEVETVLANEFTAQLAVGNKHQSLPLLQALTVADTPLKTLLAPHLEAFLEGFSTPPDSEASHHWAKHLDDILSVLNDVGGNRAKIAAVCERHFLAEPAGPQSLVWLSALFRFTPERGTTLLEDHFGSIEKSSRVARATEVFASLFGDRGSVGVPVDDQSRRAEILGRLVRSAYTYIRPDEDQMHDGVFTPDMRDDAQSARNALLSGLIDTPGPKAHRVLLDLADDPLFAHLADRLRMLARQRAATDAEFEPMQPKDVVALVHRFEAPPKDRDALFALMMDRLADLQHDLSHGDFSDRRTLRTISDEKEMQRTLARRLCDMANQAYSVERESEVADCKEPDIRIIVSNDLKAAIEIKMAENWSLSDLERALRNQLVGQYLRHESCKAGCLLLTCNDQKRRWKDTETKARLCFPDVVEHLKRIAATIEEETAHTVCVDVFGLDLTDPALAPAHRS